MSCSCLQVSNYIFLSVLFVPTSVITIHQRSFKFISQIVGFHIFYYNYLFSRNRSNPYLIYPGYILPFFIKIQLNFWSDIHHKLQFFKIHSISEIYFINNCVRSLSFDFCKVYSYILPQNEFLLIAYQGFRSYSGCFFCFKIICKIKSLHCIFQFYFHFPPLIKNSFQLVGIYKLVFHRLKLPSTFFDLLESWIFFTES